MLDGFISVEGRTLVGIYKTHLAMVAASFAIHLH